MRGLKQQHALITRTGRTAITNTRMMTFCFSRCVSIWPAALLGSSVMLWTSLSELFPRAMDALRVVSLTRAATLATAALARAAVLLLTSNGVVSTGGVVTALALVASDRAEAETSAGSIGWPLSLLLEWSVMATQEREKKDLIAKIEDLEMTIKSLADAIAKLKDEIAEMQVQMKRAGEDREKENKEFQTTVADQRETQKLLKAALNVLQDFYGKKAAFMQQHKQEPAGPPPPPGFEAYKKNAASGGVMKMIQEIINDAKAMEAEAIRSEEDAQKAYEDFVKETNASIEAKSKEIVNKSELKAKAEGELVETKEAKEAAMLELEQLSNYNAELHQSCDFVLKNFDIRQTARDEEIEALKQAKAILSGAKFEEFLQAS